MSNQEDLFIYDEDESVKFIQNYLPQELKGKYSNDDINYVVDLIYDYYESKGFLNETDEDVDVEIDEDDLIAYVVKNAKKDQVVKLEADDIQHIVQGELAYCDSINIFD
ncbi:MAG TPA: hypothetical protein DCF91_03235 [Porphyromonadaceae bacterium]|nr:hypothetical protein [Porphyromonadaceae bacterium]